MGLWNHPNAHLLRRWFVHAGAHDVVRRIWPPRSPDLTQCEFFLSGYIKYKVFIAPEPQFLPELMQRIATATASIARDTLHKVWEEVDYRNICHVAGGEHIESLSDVYKTSRVSLSTSADLKF
jgi:hypothetical protein